jgi:hypothetical protein
MAEHGARFSNRQGRDADVAPQVVFAAPAVKKHEEAEKMALFVREGCYLYS